jgi:hypothetical protein
MSDQITFSEIGRQNNAYSSDDIVDKLDSRDDVKEIIKDGINGQAKIDHLGMDIALLTNPILHIKVSNRKWEVGNSGLYDNPRNAHTWLKSHIKHHSPLYWCETADNINKTIQFSNHWIDKNFIEMYKMYPNKVNIINQRR